MRHSADEKAARGFNKFPQRSSPPLSGASGASFERHFAPTHNIVQTTRVYSNFCQENYLRMERLLDFQQQNFCLSLKENSAPSDEKYILGGKME
jgi:hypothetical protein